MREIISKSKRYIKNRARTRKSLRNQKSKWIKKKEKRVENKMRSERNKSEKEGEWQEKKWEN